MTHGGEYFVLGTKLFVHLQTVSSGRVGRPYFATPKGQLQATERVVPRCAAVATKCEAHSERLASSKPQVVSKMAGSFSGF